MCYAYRDSESEEFLLNHLVGVEKCCEERWELNALSRKISRVLGIPIDDVKNAILLSSLLHDLGKVAQKFQEECDQGICREFPGHYMISAFLVHLGLSAMEIVVKREDVSNFMEDRFDKIDKNKVTGILILFPIAFHHYHQVRGYRSYSFSEYLKEFVEKPRIWDRCIECLKSIHEYIDNNNILNIAKKLLDFLLNLDKLRNSDVYRNSKLFIENFYNNVVDKGVKLQSITLSSVVIESITGLINLCDGYVAHRARGVGRK
ncbi:MAG: CRISPR-associated endonuclease Cas3'' [Ignisphaera sp.]